MAASTGISPPRQDPIASAMKHRQKPKTFLHAQGLQHKPFSICRSQFTSFLKIPKITPSCPMHSFLDLFFPSLASFSDKRNTILLRVRHEYCWFRHLGPLYTIRCKGYLSMKNTQVLAGIIRQPHQQKGRYIYTSAQWHGLVPYVTLCTFVILFRTNLLAAGIQEQERFQTRQEDDGAVETV